MASNMYLFTEQKNAFIIDPCISEGMLGYLEDNHLIVDYIILTHEHYDHISGVNMLKDKFNCQIICSTSCAEEMQFPNRNYSKYFDVLMEVLPEGSEGISSSMIQPYSCYADVTFHEQMSLEWQGHRIEMITTPGHSKGSICILVDHQDLFSGDSLLRDYPTITRLRGGSSKAYKEKTMAYFKSLPRMITVYPGHFEPFKLGDRLKNEFCNLGTARST